MNLLTILRPWSWIRKGFPAYRCCSSGRWCLIIALSDETKVAMRHSQHTHEIHRRRIWCYYISNITQYEIHKCEMVLCASSATKTLTKTCENASTHLDENVKWRCGYHFFTFAQWENYENGTYFTFSSRWIEDLLVDQVFLLVPPCVRTVSQATISHVAWSPRILCLVLRNMHKIDYQWIYLDSKNHATLSFQMNVTTLDNKQTNTGDNRHRVAATLLLATFDITSWWTKWCDDWSWWPNKSLLENFTVAGCLNVSHYLNNWNGLI